MAADERECQIVVATEHLDLVGRELGAGMRVAADNARLGLTLVTLANAAETGRALAARRRADYGGQEPEVDSDLDRVLTELRLWSAHRYAGWMPTLGKNRTLSGVQFKPYTHGFDRPTLPAAGTVAPLPKSDHTLSRVSVGLFDTVLAPHRQLTGSYLADPDTLVGPIDDDGGERLWWEGHSTFIAGIIRRHAPSAVLDVRTALRRVPGGSGDERWSMPLWDFADLLADYQDAGVAVLNLSVGVATDDGRPPLVLERAIAQLTPSMVVVAAAGNHGEPHAATDGRPAPNAALFPAALDNVIAVGALDGTGAAAFTPRGAGQADTAPWINVFAPGVDVVSTYLGDGVPERVLVENADGSRSPVEFCGWAAWSGTSFATGEITGAVANLLARGDSPQDAVKKVQAAYPRPEQSTDA